MTTKLIPFTPSYEIDMQTMENICLEGKTEVWVKNALTQEVHVIPEAFERLMKAVKGRRSMRLYLKGHKPNAGEMHPAYAAAFADGKYYVKGENALRYYAGGDTMVEAVIYIDDEGRKHMGVMAGTPSNFFPFSKPFGLQKELGPWQPLSSPWMQAFLQKEYVSPEDLIQTLKILLATSTTYGLEGEETIAKSLEARAKKLEAVDLRYQGLECDGVVYTSYTDMNAAIARRLVEVAMVTRDPKKLKALGNACGLKASLWPMMNGGAMEAVEELDSAKGEAVPEAGNNARMMTLGLLMRLYAKDATLQTFVELCAKYEVVWWEMAMHGGIPDKCWGATLGDCRVGPDTHLVRDTQTGGLSYNAFGRGGEALVNLVVHNCPESKAFLGIPTKACCFEGFADCDALGDAIMYTVMKVFATLGE